VQPDAHGDRAAVGRSERSAQLLHLERQAREGLRVLLQRAALAGDASRGRDVGVPGQGQIWQAACVRKADPNSCPSPINEGRRARAALPGTRGSNASGGRRGTQAKPGRYGPDGLDFVDLEPGHELVEAREEVVQKAARERSERAQSTDDQSTSRIRLEPASADLPAKLIRRDARPQCRESHNVGLQHAAAVKFPSDDFGGVAGG